MNSKIHREPRSHTEPRVHAQTHSQPESISVHDARGLDELTSVVTSIDAAYAPVYDRLFLACENEGARLDYLVKKKKEKGKNR